MSTDHAHLLGQGQGGLTILTGSCPRGFNTPSPWVARWGLPPWGWGWDPGLWFPEVIAQTLMAPASLSLCEGLSCSSCPLLPGQRPR